jgi:tetraacyldisaccharide 4'-kinase
MNRLEKAWYSNVCWPKVLAPLECLFRRLAKRKAQQDKAKQWQPPVPLWVVGNIAVGGTGKTPFTIALVNELKQLGCKPGIVSRGYKAMPASFPHCVDDSDTALIAGDEPLLLKRRAQVPVVIDPDRSRACQTLLSNYDCDIIISDDGMQHYKMGRTREILLIDKARGLGNEHCLPVGPLRESKSRLADVDLVVLNGQGSFEYAPSLSMSLASSRVISLMSGQPITIEECLAAHPEVHAVAGIGHPERFFAMLEQYGFKIHRHPFGDHHAITEQDVSFDGDLPIVMTEKDAVKCGAFSTVLKQRLFYWPVEAAFETPLSSIITPWLAQDRASLSEQRP